MSQLKAVLSQLQDEISWKARVNSISESELKKALVKKLTEGDEND